MPDLLIAHFFGGAKETIARVAHDDVDAPEFGKRTIDHGSHHIGVGDVQNRNPEPVTVLCPEAVQAVASTHCRCHVVTARQQFLRQYASKSGGCPCKTMS